MLPRVPVSVAGQNRLDLLAAKLMPFDTEPHVGLPDDLTVDVCLVFAIQ